MGPPVGIFIDHHNLGPRPAVLIGAVLLAVGYFPLHQAYDRGSGSVATLCFLTFLTGWGSCLAFLAAIKTSAMNWPQHRGAATAFPLAAFGLSAFFFSFLGSVLFPGDPSAFLELLSWGTCGLTLLGFFFLKTYPDSSYEAVPASDGAATSSSSRTSANRSDEEPGTSSSPLQHITVHPPTPESPASSSSAPSRPEPVLGDAADETSPLVSGAATPLFEEAAATTAIDQDRSHHVDIRGVQLLFNLGFWQLFMIMAVLSGVGLMTIK